MKIFPPVKESGFALLSVLVVLAVLTPLVVNLSYKTNVQLTGAGYYVGKVKSREIARAGLESAMLALRKDTNDYDSPLEEWGEFEELSRLSVSFFEEGGFTGRIADEEGKLNINNLVNGPAEGSSFEALLELQEVDPDLLWTVWDWLDNNSKQESAMGAEDSYYNSQENPYNSKDGRMDSLYELRLIKGVSDDIFLGDKEKTGLVELVTVFGDDDVNINTAPLEVLLSLSENMDYETAERIIEYREKSAIEKKEELKEIDGVTNDIYLSIAPHIKVKSSYFSVIIRGVYRDISTDLYAVVKRKGRQVSLVQYSEG